MVSIVVLHEEGITDLLKTDRQFHYFLDLHHRHIEGQRCGADLRDAARLVVLPGHCGHHTIHITTRVELDEPG